MTDPPEPAGEPGPPAEPVGPTMAPVPPTRHLVGASFDLLSRSTDEMRSASFYIGAIVLGTVGGGALAAWAFAVASVHLTVTQTLEALTGGLSGWLGLLVIIGSLGVVVAGVESRAMAAAVLGSQAAGRPVSVRAALARSRSVFWRVILGSIIVAIPLWVAQAVAGVVLLAVAPTAGDVSTVVSLILASFIGAPFVYVLCGVVLGDVDPIEATRRSFRVFGARRGAAVVVALFESIAQLLVLFGFSAGLDIGLRLLSALGLGVDSGTAGIVLTTLMMVAGVFALGTLMFTVSAISIAPQVVMFVGLTHATMGLDRVRTGADHDPDTTWHGRRRFRRFTRPMLAAFILSILALFGSLSALPT